MVFSGGQHGRLYTGVIPFDSSQARYFVGLLSIMPANSRVLIHSLNKVVIEPFPRGHVLPALPVVPKDLHDRLDLLDRCGSNHLPSPCGSSTIQSSCDEYQTRLDTE